MNLEEFLAKDREAIASREAAGNYLNRSGGMTPTEEAAIQNEADKLSFGELTSMGFDTINAATGLGYKAAQMGIAPDPNFKLGDNWETLTKDIPQDYHVELLQADSMVEGMYIRERIQDELQKKQMLAAAGGRGFAAQILPSLVDIDGLLVLMSGGSYLGAKMATGLTRAGVSSNSKLYGASVMAARGAEAGFITESVNASVRPSGEAQDALYATIGGMAFGGVLGLAARTDAVKTLGTDEKGMVDIPFGGKGIPEDDVNRVIADTKAEMEDRVDEHLGYI